MGKYFKAFTDGVEDIHKTIKGDKVHEAEAAYSDAFKGKDISSQLHASNILESAQKDKLHTELAVGGILVGTAASGIAAARRHRNN